MVMDSSLTGLGRRLLTSSTSRSKRQRRMMLRELNVEGLPDHENKLNQVKTKKFGRQPLTLAARMSVPTERRA